jgi:hypothetical protein
MALPSAQCDAEETECHLKSGTCKVRSRHLNPTSFADYAGHINSCTNGLRTIPASVECYSERKKVLTVSNISSYLTYMSVLPPVQLTR